jgi:hypothetical protein
MAPNDALSLVKYLRRGTARTRIGLWRVPLAFIGTEQEIAISLGIQAIDISRYYFNKLPTGTKVVKTTSSKVIDSIDSIASSIGPSDCVLIFNFDLLLAKLKIEETQQVWVYLFNHLPNRLRAILIMMPETTLKLLPSDTLIEKWEKEDRLI